jgi:predicted permease
MRRQPGFVTAAAATFALGIGAATAIFSVVYGVAFRPLPYPRADQLVRVYEANTATNEPKLYVSDGTFHAWRDALSSISGIALYTPLTTRYTRDDEPQPLTTMGVSPRFFDVLGVRPAHGRTFKAESEYGAGTVDELIISHEFWERRFSRDLRAIGRSIDLVATAGEDRFVIVGVMPRGFQFDGVVDAWRPVAIRLPISRALRAARDNRVVARLRDDRSLDQLRAELDVVSEQLARDFPVTNAQWSATVEPLLDSIVGRFSRASWMLLTAIAAVLFAACANITGLLNARRAARMREIGIRVALGATRWHITNLFLREALTLAMLGGLAGVVMAWWLVSGLRASAPPGLPRVGDIAVDLPVLAFALGATVFTAVVCALIPAANPRPLRHHRMSAVLVVVQSAAALALVIVAIVLSRSFLNLIAVDLGWRPARVLSLHVAPRWPQEIRRPWFLYATWAERLVARLEATPGVGRAAVTTVVPFSPDAVPEQIARGRDASNDEPRWPVTAHRVTTGYFDAIGVRLRRGRLFDASDRFDEAALTSSVGRGTGVAIVTASVARTLWPGQDAIGQQVRLSPGNSGDVQQVIGIVDDVEFAAVGAEPVLHIFLPWLQYPTGRPRLLVRTTGSAAAAASGVRTAVLAEHSATGIDRVVPVETLVDRATARARVIAQLMSGLGLLALLLATVGVYGSLSLLVHSRVRDTAVRLALGASPAQTLRRTMFQGLFPVLIGGIAGLVTAYAAITLGSSLLYGIDSADTWSLLGGVLIMLGASAAGCLAPALKAARIDPFSVLRS